MPTQPYKINGKRVPSVTTVLGRFKESGGLIHWAWDLGMQNIDYRKIRDDAANAGTLAHLMVETTIRKLPFPEQEDYTDDTWQKAMNSFGAFQEWSQQTRLVPDQTEVSLTCKCHAVGGTLDTILVQDRLSLGDWKTSNAVYQDHLCQLAAYRHLWEVNNPDRPITGGFHLLRFSKSNGDFTHHYWAELDDAWTMFQHLRAAYDADKILKGRI